MRFPIDDIDSTMFLPALLIGCSCGLCSASKFVLINLICQRTPPRGAHYSCTSLSITQIGRIRLRDTIAPIDAAHHFTFCYCNDDCYSSRALTSGESPPLPSSNYLFSLDSIESTLSGWYYQANTISQYQVVLHDWLLSRGLLALQSARNRLLLKIKQILPNLISTFFFQTNNGFQHTHKNLQWTVEFAL